MLIRFTTNSCHVSSLSLHYCSEICVCGLLITLPKSAYSMPSWLSWQHLSYQKTQRKLSCLFIFRESIVILFHIIFLRTKLLYLLGLILCMYFVFHCFLLSHGPSSSGFWRHLEPFSKFYFFSFSLICAQVYHNINHKIPSIQSFSSSAPRQLIFQC